MASLYGLLHFSYDSTREQNNGFEVRKLAVEEEPFGSTVITACCFFKINAELSYLSQYDRQLQRSFVVGCQDGSVRVSTGGGDKWSVFSRESGEIVTLQATQLYLCVAAHSSLVHFYDVRLR